MKKWLDDFLPKDLLVIVKIALFTASAVIFLYVLKFYSYDLSEDSGDWGTFGDYVGGLLNPFLSFLALIVLLRTYSTQRKELEETQKILNEQKETQKRQQFESTFFELLKMHNETLDKVQNLLSLEQIVCDLDSADPYSRFPKTIHISGLWHYLPLAKKELEKTYSYQHYFRTLYQLLEFIAVHSESSIDSELNVEDIEKDTVSNNEKMYSNIVRALLPNDVINLLAIDCFCDKESHYTKYKLLIERYAFFEYASFNTFYVDKKDISFSLKRHDIETAIFKEIRGYKCQDGRHIDGYYKAQAFGIKFEPSQNQENS